MARSLTTIAINLALAAAFAMPARAQTRSLSVQRFSRDAIAAALLAGDAASTRECQHFYPSCYETNRLLGPHPSDAQLYGYNAAVLAGMIAGNHLLKGKRANALLWIGTAALAGIEIRCIRNNLQIANALGKAQR